MARGIRDEQPDVTVTGVIVKRTSDKAILIITPTAEEVWLPRSQLRGASADLKSGPDKVSVTMSAWIAGEKSLSGSVDSVDGGGGDEDDTGGYDD